MMGTIRGTNRWETRVGSFVPPARVIHVFVYCDECEHWISDEDRHECQLRPAYAAARRRLRRTKQTEAWGSTYDY